MNISNKKFEFVFHQILKEGRIDIENGGKKAEPLKIDRSIIPETWRPTIVMKEVEAVHNFYSEPNVI